MLVHGTDLYLLAEGEVSITALLPELITPPQDPGEPQEINDCSLKECELKSDPSNVS